MAIKLCEGEKIVRNYDYARGTTMGIANSSKATSNLTITNRRVIHTTKKGGMGKEQVSVQELPIKYIRTVNSFYGKRSYPFLLVLAVLFFIEGIVLAANIEDNKALCLILCWLLTLVCVLVFIFKRDYSYRCRIVANGIIYSGMSMGIASGNSLTRGLFNSLNSLEAGTTIMVKVKVNGPLTQQMASELGAIILDVKNGLYD